MSEIRRRLLRSKIHNAVVTDANLEYQGSITIPPHLLESSDINEYEAVSVWNLTRGTRFETYAITGEENSADICVNGAAAHLCDPGDRVIIACFVDVPQSQVAKHEPIVIFLDENNAPTPITKEIPGPRLAN